MYTKNSKKITNCQQETQVKYTFLSDKKADGKERPWREKKLKTMELAESYERLGMTSKAYRVKDCGNYLAFKLFLENKDMKLHAANFCKVRLCPLCSWRRSLKIYGQVSAVMEKATEDKENEFIFLTLTAKNVEGDELEPTLDQYFKAWNLLMKRKKVKQAIKGYFRALEVTHNLNNDTYHPHFHVVLMVNKSYFRKKELYINQKDWSQYWGDCLGIDYNPIVHIQKIKSTTKRSINKAVAESAKYTVKDTDVLIRDENGNIQEELTDNAVFILDRALRNRRLISFGGEFKKIHKMLSLDDTENGDLINLDNSQEMEQNPSLEYIIVKYHWNIGYRQFIKFEE